MPNPKEDFELEHHGVKGMKWGQRKARPAPSRAKNNQARYNNESTKNQLRADKKQIKIDKKEAKRLARSMRNKDPFKNPQTHAEWLAAHSKIDVTRIGTKDLQTVNQRLQLEKTFAELTKPTRKEKSWIRKNLEEGVKDAVKTQIKSRTNAHINALIGSPSDIVEKKRKQKEEKEKEKEKE